MIRSSRLLGTGDVARLLCVSPQYVRRLASSGKLRAEMTSTGRVFLESDVLAFQGERERKALHDPRISLRKD